MYKKNDLMETDIYCKHLSEQQPLKAAGAKCVGHDAGKRHRPNRGNKYPWTGHTRARALGARVTGLLRLSACKRHAAHCSIFRPPQDRSEVVMGLSLMGLGAPSSY